MPRTNAEWAEFWDNDADVWSGYVSDYTSQITDKNEQLDIANSLMDQLAKLSIYDSEVDDELDNLGTGLSNAMSELSASAYAKKINEGNCEYISGAIYECKQLIASLKSEISALESELSEAESGVTYANNMASYFRSLED